MSNNKKSSNYAVENYTAENNTKTFVDCVRSVECAAQRLEKKKEEFDNARKQGARLTTHRFTY